MMASTEAALIHSTYLPIKNKYILIKWKSY